MKEAITVVVWLGLDVHKKTICACWLVGDSQEEEFRELTNTAGNIKRLVSKLRRRGEVRACYEAGPCGYEVKRLLDGMGVACDVIAPSLIPRRPGDRIKTDRRDARKLARLYRAGELQAIGVPTTEQEAVRDLLRCREDVLEDCTRAWHRLNRFLLRHGRVCPGTRNGSKRHWEWLRAQRFDDPAMQRTLVEYRALVDFMRDRLHGLDKEVGEIASKDPWRERVDRLCVLRGIGKLSALTLLAEIVDFHRFKPRQLAAFLGLVPSLYSSGDRAVRGRITGTGNSHARRIVVEAAWHHRHVPQQIGRVRLRAPGQADEVHRIGVKAQHRLHLRYQRLRATGHPSTVAVTAVARELTGFIWALMTLEARHTEAPKKKVFQLRGRTRKTASDT